MVTAEAALAFLKSSREPGALGRLDHYEVLEVIGRGATGVVLRAKDTKLLRPVAIKVLAARLAASDSARRRFIREAQAAAAVRDDHVVAIHAVSEDGPVPYLVMEYVSGITLEERTRKDKALELKEVLRIGMQVAAGLAAAHAQGVVHRDIKPANILLENGVQRVKIADFGLARAADQAGTAAGASLAGTPLYMSPEQARGEPTDHRTDLFSLGSLLYTLCAGRPPFQADTTAAVLKRVCEDPPAPLCEINPEIPNWLCDAIAKLHTKEVGKRWASAREVADLLSERLALLQQPPRTAPASAAADSGLSALPARRTFRILAVLLGGLLIALTILAVWLKPWQRWAPAHESGNATPRERREPARPLELRREDIPPLLLSLAGDGNPKKAPPELVAVLGDGPFLLPRIGQTAWMKQSPDGKVLAVPLDEDVVLFEAATGKYLRTLKGPGGRVFHVCFGRGGELLAATTRLEGVGGAARVWDLRSDQMLFTNRQTGPTVSCAATFSADGAHLLTEVDGRIHVCDARSGELRRKVDVPGKGIASMGFSPDGRRLAVALFFSRQVKVFDWDRDRLAEAYTRDHPAPVTADGYSPDGKFLASGDRSRLKVWDAQTLAEVFSVETEAEQLAFAPDSRTLYAASTVEEHRAVHTFRRWDVLTRKPLPALPAEVAAEPVRAFHCLSTDGKVLFAAQQHDATCIRAIDTATGKELFPRAGHVAPLNAVVISPDGRTLASAGRDRAVKVWDLAGGRLLHSFAAHSDAVGGLAFSPDGLLLASGSRDGTIALWDVENGTEVRALHGHSRSPSRIQFSPDGRTLAAGGDHGTVKTWEVATGKEGRSLPGHSGVVRGVAFSPDGQWLAAGGEDKMVLLHNLAGGPSQTFKAPKAVNDVTFSPDGRRVAAVGDGPEPVVCLWDLETLQEITGRGHSGHVHGLAFSPAAPLLATGSEDGTVRLWDLSAAPPRVRTLGPGPFGGRVGAVAFTPDGRYLATANANGTVYLLRVGDSASN
jgi:WD40 repeat protein/predicted Ser/Thr protein kinase